MAFTRAELRTSCCKLITSIEFAGKFRMPVVMRYRMEGSSDNKSFSIIGSIDHPKNILRTSTQLRLSQYTLQHGHRLAAYVGAVSAQAHLHNASASRDLVPGHEIFGEFLPPVRTQDAVG